jgi:hypothetical protein
MAESFCLPLELRIHQGFKHLEKDVAVSSIIKLSLGERVVHMAMMFAIAHNHPAFLVLDAFFSTASVFRLAHSVYSVSLKQPYLEILTRAKKNYVAYFPAPQKPSSRPGPQSLYGEKVYLMEFFDHFYLFETVKCCVYGTAESIQIFSVSLLWKPVGNLVLFIFAITSRGPIVLMSSDLNLSPIAAIELYCARSRIEVMFDVLKNIIGAFAFRFWSKLLPLHSRSPVSNRNLRAPSEEHLLNIIGCWRSYEVFVLCASIAMGLLQLISLQFSFSVWKHHMLYLRTQSRSLPSEKTVRQVLSKIIILELMNLPENSMIAKIRRSLMGTEDDDGHLVHT